MSVKMIIYLDYKILKKDNERIKILNSYYDKGHEIHVWVEDTSLFLHNILKELEGWGCKFNYIKLGKPAYDILIDDNSFGSDLFFSGKTSFSS